MRFSDFCKEIEKRLQSLPRAEDRLAFAAEALRAAFRVQRDEVAIFGYSPQLQVLRFLWPPHLQEAGIIPLAARQSLVCPTFLENRSMVDNRFNASPHLAIFELVRKSNGEKSLPIQKILSAPIGREGSFRGVVQVCRKGEDAESGGPDFSQTDLNALVRLTEILARHLEFSDVDSSGGEDACAS